MMMTIKIWMWLVLMNEDTKLNPEAELLQCIIRKIRKLEILLKTYTYVIIPSISSLAQQHSHFYLVIWIYNFLQRTPFPDSFATICGHKTPFTLERYEWILPTISSTKLFQKEMIWSRFSFFILPVKRLFQVYSTLVIYSNGSKLNRPYVLPAWMDLMDLNVLME